MIPPPVLGRSGVWMSEACVVRIKTPGGCFLEEEATQIYGDYYKPLQRSLSTNQNNGMSLMVLNIAQMNLGVSHKSFTGVGRNNLDTLQLWILDVPVSKKNVFNIECFVKNDSHYDFRIFFQCLPTFLFSTNFSRVLLHELTTSTPKVCCPFESACTSSSDMRRVCSSLIGRVGTPKVILKQRSPSLKTNRQ